MLKRRSERESGSRRYHRKLAVPRLLALLLLLPACAAAPSRYEFAASELGTRVSLVLWAVDAATAEAASRAAFARIDELDAVLSDWRPDSELNALGRVTAGIPVAVADDLWQVLRRADEIVRASDGAFDPTVGPLVRLWRRARRERALPSPDRIEAAMRRVGWRELVRLDAATQSVTLLRAGMQLDLGGIAKGYIADAALAVLREHGIERALIEAGGDLALGAPPPGAVGWRVGLQSPWDFDQRSTITVADCGVATSGDAYQFVEIGGVRYSHLVDPRTGLGLVDAGQVTVVAADGITADALASALSVIGQERAAALLAQFPGASAAFEWPIWWLWITLWIPTAGFPVREVAGAGEAR